MGKGINMKAYRKISVQLDHPPTAIAFHPHEKIIFVGDKSGNVDLFDLVNGISIQKLSKSSAPILAIGFKEDSIYTFNNKGEIACWDLRTFTFKNSTFLPIINVDEAYVKFDRLGLLVAHEARITSAQFDPQGRYLIIGRERESFSWPYSDLLQVDLQNDEIREYDFERRDSPNMDKIAISKDGKQICASGLDVYITSDGDWGFDSPEFIAQWNLENRSKVCSYECDHASTPHDHHEFTQTFSPDHQQLLVSLNGELSLWDVSQGEIFEAEEHLGHFDITEIDWSPTSDLVAFGKKDGTVCFYDMNLREILFEEKLFIKPVSCIKFSSDGCYLAAFSEDNSVAIYNINYNLYS